ncbi:MAG: M23 family metallopeptidase [Bacteroidales bacterium]|nr:M23 family metallopeptidase [Bacteroidales bacterium]
MAIKNPTLFRLTLSDDASHKKIRVWHFSRLGGVVAGITALVVLFGIFYAIVALTPLKNAIPGYPDAHFKRDAIANALKIDSLENQMFRWTLYAENLSRILAGEEGLSEADSIIAGNPSRYMEKVSSEELARRDSVLRATVAAADRFGVAGVKRNLPIEGLHFFTPIKGAVSRGFDILVHPGIDISAPAGSVVCAVLDGTVISAGWTDEAAYSVIIQHQANIISCYRHGQHLLVKEGDKVAAGKPLAVVGASGLHFEIWHEGEPEDPAKYCKF